LRYVVALEISLSLYYFLNIEGEFIIDKKLPWEWKTLLLWKLKYMFK